jgi:hypothetical protein
LLMELSILLIFLKTCSVCKSNFYLWIRMIQSQLPGTRHLRTDELQTRIHAGWTTYFMCWWYQ